MLQESSIRDPSTGLIRRLGTEGPRSNAKTLSLVAAKASFSDSTLNLHPVVHHAAVITALLTTNLVEGSEIDQGYLDVTLPPGSSGQQSMDELHNLAQRMPDGQLQHIALACVATYLTPPVILMEYHNTRGRQSVAWPFVDCVYRSMVTLGLSLQVLLHDLIDLQVGRLPVGVQERVGRAFLTRCRRADEWRALQSQRGVPVPAELAVVRQATGDDGSELPGTGLD